MIQAQNITYSYNGPDMGACALNGVTMSVRPGELVVILGRNGCGKSTLAKHFNALLELQHGTLMVAGRDAGNAGNLWQLRRAVGMVFQNPDNQFVSTIVEEDVAFGLENYGTPLHEIPQKVSAALRAVGMAGFEQRSTHRLSGGQKQRVALAGVLAMSPEVLVFDEATSMLDPGGRREVLSTIRRLHDEEHKTIVMITHYIEEATFADRIYLMHDGKMLADGTPKEILMQPELLAQAELTPPLPVRMYYDLKAAGIALSSCPLTVQALAEELCQLQ